MEKSFTSWRASANLIENASDSDDSQETKFGRPKEILAYDSDGESDSEIVSSSHSKLYIPDTDESFTREIIKNSDSDNKREVVVPDSDDEISDEADTKSFQSSSLPGASKSSRRSKNSSHYSFNNSSIRSRSRFVPDSDDEISSDKVDTKSFQSSSLLGASKSCNRSKNSSHDSFNNSSIRSNSSKLTHNKESSLDVIKLAKRKNINRLISSDEDDSIEKSEYFNISDVVSEDENVSSTSMNKTKSIKDHNSLHSSPNYKISDSEESPVKGACALEISKTKPLPTIDLTLPWGGVIIEDHNNALKTSNSVNLTRHKGTITISSDSEEDKQSQSILAQEEQLNAQLTNIHISKNDNLNSLREDKKEVKQGGFEKRSENDYASRLESLKAEQTRLDAQVKEVLKSLETTKSTLRTANMEALPDKGIRLQMNLKKFESKLRDLRYQQNTLSNEIIRLQLMPNSGSVPKPIQSLPPQQKMFKLPTTSTDINAMGKKAMETHRTQQAMTVDALRALHNSLKNCPSDDTFSSDPDGLKVELMPHQKYALSWLLWREKEKPSGGILADDMGLGKTLTMISLILKSNEDKGEEESDSDSNDEKESTSKSNWLSSQRAKLVPGKTLIVCPASLLGQWELEVQRRVRRGTLDVLVHHGPNREKRARRLARPDMVITTYNIVNRDSHQPESPLFQIKWERVILDEAHQIRNYKTLTAQAVFQLKARSRWVLTGTPVQNKELDLYALLKFLRCSPFDDLAVWKTWVDNRDAAGQQRLNTIIKSIMLRRTKKGLQEVGELKGLPEKNISSVFIKMDKEEWAVYEKMLNFSKTLFAQFLHQKAEKENALSGIPIKSKSLQHVEDPFKDHPELARLHRQMREISDVKSHHILLLILRLRQFCCHPSLIQSMLEKEEISNSGVEDSDGLDIDLMDKMTRMSIVNNSQESQEDKIDWTAMDKDNPLFSKDRIGSKLRKVIKTIEDILTTSKDKLLVVSQWVSHLDLVDNVLKERGIKCLRLTGQVAVKDRAEIVDMFNIKDHGPRVLLLSLTAGGVGLNLVGANHLLLLDLHWNPQLENQACDRIYRVGQDKNVQIYKFVTSETIEESVLKLQEGKLNVANSVLTGSKHSSKLTLDDLKALFKIN